MTKNKENKIVNKIGFVIQFLYKNGFDSEKIAIILTIIYYPFKITNVRHFSFNVENKKRKKQIIYCIDARD